MIRPVESKAVLLVGAFALLLVSHVAQAKGFATLYAFQGGTDGSQPSAGMVADAAGNLYGTTAAGGASGCSTCGTVFKLAPDGTETVLHDFGAYTGDAASPRDGVTIDSNGNLFGTTADGGAHNLGSIFEIAADGSESVLYSFAGMSDGSDPSGGLVLDGKGNLYGTTYINTGSAGAVFKFAADGSFKTVYGFKGGKDGANPTGTLAADANGNLYGTTRAGGSKGCGGSGCGTIFKVTPKGAETVLHSFTGGSDQCSPMAGILRDASGNLYGTTTPGATCKGDLGIVFRLAPDGSFAVLHTFSGSDGAFPYGGLVADRQGNLYGTAELGGAKCCGTVFEVAAGGSFRVLHNFSGTRDGGYSLGGVLLLNGNLYGTTSAFGQHANGTVFRMEK